MDPMITALVILIITIALFIWEPIPIIVTAIGASIAYAYTGIIEVGDIFTGYNSDTIVLLAGMMVVGASLFHAGITDMIGEKMIKVTGKSERNIILATLIVSCTISSVCSNIGVMTAMAPLVTAMCLAAGIGPSKALLALLFGAQFGGFVTLVGVGSNATANSVMEQMGITPFGFFSITPFGIGVCVLGTLYFTFVGRKFIPDTGYVPEFAQTDRKPLDKKKAVIAVVTLLCVLVVIAASPDNIPMHVAAVVGALVIVGTKCMTVQEAIKAIDWNCMLLVGSLTAISTGVTNSGLGDAVAQGILNILGDNPSTFMITTVIFFAAALLTQVNPLHHALPAHRHLHRQYHRREPLSGGHDHHPGRRGLLRHPLRRPPEHDDRGLDPLQVPGLYEDRHAHAAGHLCGGGGPHPHLPALLRSAPWI